MNSDLNEAAAALGKQFAAEGFEVKSREAGGEMQVGAKRIPIERANCWRRLEASASRAWIDVIELPDEAAAGRIPAQWRQPHTGNTYPDAFAFMALRVENGLDSLGSVVVRGRHVINLGIGLPFRVRLWESPGDSICRGSWRPGRTRNTSKL